MTLSTEGSFNYYYVRGETKNPGSGYRNEGGSYALSQTTKEQTNLNVNMNLNKEWGDFETHGLIRGEYYHSYAQSMSVRTDGGLVVPNKFFISNSKNPVVSSGSITGTKTMWSAMAQLGASWKGQVYLDVTGRNDWSSALLYSDGHGTYSYFYPSVSGSVVISELLPLPEILNFWKVRGSWTQTKFPDRGLRHQFDIQRLPELLGQHDSRLLSFDHPRRVVAATRFPFIRNRYGTVFLQKPSEVRYGLLP